MITYNFKQGSPEWIEKRLGIPTASEFHRILTPGGKLSAQAKKYAHRLITEIMTQTQMDSLDDLEWIDRGKDLEPDAVRMYQLITDCDPISVGFITTDDGRVGASPDRLIGDHGLLEIKCPAPQTQVDYMLDGFDADYKPQVQGQLWISDREWCDFLSYHPDMPPVRIRIPRDEEYILTLAKAVTDFVSMKEEMLEKIKAKGFFAPRKKVLLTADKELGDQVHAEA